MSKGTKILISGLAVWFLGTPIIDALIPGLGGVLALAGLGMTIYGIYRLSSDRKSGRKQQKSAQSTPTNQADRAAQVISLMNDEGAIAVFNAGAVMTSDEHKNFKKLVDQATSEPQRLNLQGNINAYGVGSIVGHAVGRGIGNLARNKFVGQYPNNVSYSCAVGNISDTDRQLLRIAAILMKHGVIDPLWLEKALAGAIFESGNRTIHEMRNKAEQYPVYLESLPKVLEACLVNENVLQQEVIPLAERAKADKGNSPLAQEIAKLADGGASWLGGADIPGSIYNPTLGKGLFLGGLEDGTRLNYDGEGSLFTIAPPGAGKSQCQVIPNLLAYGGPAIVLDIKGECYDDTAGFRSHRYGKVIRFAPHDKQNSARYNPLDFVRSNPEHLASDARKMADMLIVSSSTKDPYWDNKGRDFLTAYIAFVALLPAGDPERTMQTVMDLMSPTEEMLKNAVDELRNTGVKYLGRIANQISTMPEKQRESAMDVARMHLSAWDLGDLDDVTTHCDWKPEDFRNPGRPITLYLCVLPEDVDRFASVLRVIIGQHLEHFMKEIPEKTEQPIVFFLDEAPQLGNFEPLPKASALGRQYGLQLWLFAQNKNQIEEAYNSADTILGNAVVQCWMNCDEDAAAKLERNLGTSRGLIDGRTKPLVQSHELRGPEYQDKIIVVGRGQKPARLIKRMVFDDPELSHFIGHNLNSGNGGAAVVEEEMTDLSVDNEIPPQTVDRPQDRPADTNRPS